MDSKWSFALDADKIFSWEEKDPYGVRDAIVQAFEDKFNNIDHRAVEDVKVGFKLKENSWDELWHLLKTFSRNCDGNSKEQIFFDSILGNLVFGSKQK
jgi:hypothetical protein